MAYHASVLIVEQLNFYFGFNATLSAEATKMNGAVPARKELFSTRVGLSERAHGYSPGQGYV